MNHSDNTHQRPQVCMLGYFVFEGDSRVQNYVKFLLTDGQSVDVICLGTKDYRTVDSNRGTVNIFITKDRKEKERNKLNYLWNVFIYCCFATYKVTRLYLKNRYSVIHIHNLPDFLVFT